MEQLQISFMIPVLHVIDLTHRINDLRTLNFLTVTYFEFKFLTVGISKNLKFFRSKIFLTSWVPNLKIWDPNSQYPLNVSIICHGSSSIIYRSDPSTTDSSTPPTSSVSTNDISYFSILPSLIYQLQSLWLLHITMMCVTFNTHALTHSCCYRSCNLPL